MLRRRNSNNRVRSISSHLPRYLLQFVLRIGDGIRKNPYRGIRYALLHQNLAVIFFLAHKMDSQRRQFPLRSSRLAHSHRRRISRFVNGSRTLRAAVAMAGQTTGEYVLDHHRVALIELHLE